MEDIKLGTIDKIKIAIYNFGVDTIGLFLKLGLILYSPIKFIQLWIESYKKLNNKK